jgi:hypothetical protein
MLAPNAKERLKGLGDALGGRHVLSLLAVATTVAWLSSAGCIGVSQKRAAGGGIIGGDVADLNVCRAGIRIADDGAIDDFEDGNNQLSLEGGRDGYWYTAKDTKGSTIEMSTQEGGAGGSEESMHITGTTVSGGDESLAWGASVGAMFAGKGAYDGSKYAGIVFKARATGTGQVRFNIGDINTHLDGKVCEACWNHFGKTLSLTPEWKEYRILFTDARQMDGWGKPRPAAITPSKLYNLEFKIGPGQTFDISIDDMAFLSCR